jgi:membrane fusion protein (multidrug efflux system)
LPSQSTIFREEALEFHLRGSRARGDLLHISPRWTAWTYWLLVAVFFAGLAYVIFGSINKYATGTAIIKDEGHTIITAVAGGAVADITVKPGQRVQTNQPLLRFNDIQERIEVERLQRELDLQEINRLKNPNDWLTQQQLATIRAQVEAAEKRLKERTVTAPRAGTIGDIRIHHNQLIAQGESLLTLVSDDAALSVIAILPGHYRPLLKRGNPLRMELTGFRYAYQDLTINSIESEVVGPNEVRRFLGREIADSLALQDSWVIAQAHLSSRKFRADGRWQAYHDGMKGTAEVCVGSERLLFVLVPGLKAAFGGEDE